jgi:hypothetical protein
MNYIFTKWLFQLVINKRACFTKREVRNLKVVFEVGEILLGEIALGEIS